MAIPLQGTSPSLQGNAVPLQGSAPSLQPAGSPTYGPPAPVVAPKAPAAPKPVATPRIGTAASVQVAQPDNQINSIFSPFIGSRPSASNPGTLEYYNKQTGQGFSNEHDLYNFASSLGAGVIGSFDQLHAPVQGLQAGFQNQQPANSNQTTAQQAGTAGLTPAEYLSLIQQQNQITPDQLQKIQQQLGIPELANEAFQAPQQSSVDFYNQLYGSSGLADVKQKIADLNAQVAQRQQNLLDAQGTINENPFLDEASRVGRVSRLNDKAQAEINNLLQQQQEYQTLYQNGLSEINNVVINHTADFTLNQQLNSQKLTYLLAQAEQQKSALQAQNQQAAYQYLPAYLQAKAKAQAPTTVQAPSGAVFYYDRNSGTFQQLAGAGGNYDVNPLTGDVFSKNTGQNLGASSGSLSIPTNTLAYRNNNPGNLRYVGQPGATQGEGGFAKFATPDAGYQAYIQQVQLDASRGLTLGQFINKYAPPSENNTSQYLQQAIAALGVSANTPLNQIDINQLAAFQLNKESGTTFSQSTNVVQTLAEQLLNGSAAPSQTKDRKEYGAAVALADQLSMQRYGKHFDTQAADINYKNAQDIRPILNNEASANAHLDTVLQDAKDLGLTGNRLANIGILDAKLAVGDTAAKKYVQAVQDAQSEIAKVLAGTGAVTDDVRRQAEGFLDKYVGPDTLQGLIDQARSLMHQKVVAYTAQRNTSGQATTNSNVDLSGLNFQF